MAEHRDFQEPDPGAMPGEPADDPILVSPTTPAAAAEPAVPPPEPPPTTAEPARHGGGLAASLLLSALVGLVAGGVGAWAYQHVLDGRITPRDRPARGATADEPAGGGGIMARDLSDRVESLSSKVEALGEQVAALPAMPDLKPIREKVDEIDGLSLRVNDLSKKFDALPKEIAENEKEIESNSDRLDDLKTRVTGIRRSSRLAPAGSDDGQAAPAADTEAAPGGDEPADASGTGTGTGPDSGRPRGVDDPHLASALSLFEDREYAAARDAFLRLTEEDPDDARAWYFAALANGFATGDWRGETERLVKRGVERERAGTPTRAEIDAAVADADLTAATGKDWLAAYRKRAR
jgi:TolA-binding protein